MPALNQNLEIWQDRTSIITIPIYQVDGVTPYTATTPVSAVWVMSVNARSAALLEKDVGSGIALNQNGTTMLWTATVTLLPADTKGISPQAYYHELSVTDNVGDIVNVTIGTLTLAPSVKQY